MPASGHTPFAKQALIDALAVSGLASLGTSRQGRPIVGGAFGRGPGSRRIMVVGGVHGDEPSSVEAVLDLVSRLRSDSLDPTDRQLSPDFALILPALNPDGLLQGRKNSASDVDLNRNFPARNFSREHLPGYDPGPFPLSEPETTLLARLCDDHAIDAVVAVHAPFACVNFDGPARDWAEAVAAACGWPVRADIGYSTPGSLGSWLGVDRNLPVLTLELPPGPLDPFRTIAASALDAAITTLGLLD